MIGLPSKGYLTYQACRHFGKLPDKDTMNNLKAEGWNFRSITGPDGSVLNTIYHPDGKPIDGMGSPGYVRGDDDAFFGQGITGVDKEVREKRWKDFSSALSHIKPKN